MSQRSAGNSQYKLYNAQSDYEFYLSEISIVLFACGLNGESPEQYTIDDILETISDVFPDNTLPLVRNDVMAKVFKPAASCFTMKQQLMFTTFIKRAWRNHALAKTRLENA